MRSTSTSTFEDDWKVVPHMKKGNNRGRPQQNSGYQQQRPTYQKRNDSSANNNRGNYSNRNNYRDEKSWVRENCQTLTAEQCLARWSTNEEKMVDGINSLINNIGMNHSFLNVLQTIWENKKWPAHIKSGKSNGFSPLHIANWAKNCDIGVMQQLYRFLHQIGYDVFEANDKGENAFSSVLAITKPPRSASKDEMKQRYFALADITKQQVSRIVIGVLNRVGSENPVLIDQLRYALIVDQETTLDTIASVLVSRQTISLCGKIDQKAYTYIGFLLRVFSGADTMFKNEKINEKSLELFFAENDYELDGANALLKKLWKTCYTKAFNSTRGENSDLDLEAISSLIGAFANNNFFIEEYNIFVENCIIGSTDSFNKIDQVLRIKMSICATMHAKLISQNIRNLFNMIINDSNVSGFLKHKLMTVLEDANIVTMHQMAPVKKQKEVEFRYFNSISSKFQDEFNDNVEDAIYSIEQDLKKYPEQKNKIVKAVAESLMEEMTQQSVSNMKVIIENVLTFFQQTSSVANFHSGFERLYANVTKKSDDQLSIDVLFDGQI